MAVTCSHSGHVESISLLFINSLIALLSTLSETFEEDLARISSMQRTATRVYKDVPIDKQMLLVNADFEEYLREAMEKLRIEQEASFKELVETCPGLEAILEMADPRTRDMSLALSRGEGDME